MLLTGIIPIDSFEGDVLDQTNGSVRVWPVMLQPALQQMTDDGLIEPLRHAAGRPNRVAAQDFRVCRLHVMPENGTRQISADFIYVAKT